MSEKGKKSESKTPDFFDGIKPESLENALKVGIIYPKFKAYKNTVYRVYLIDNPKFVDNEKGKFWTIDVEKDGMKYTLNTNESFKFQLKVLLERNKIDLQTLIRKQVPLFISQDNNGYWSIQLT